MKILSIETSSKISSVALLEDEKLIKEISINNGTTHSETLMPTVEKILNLCNLEIDNIDLLVCGVGPRVFYRY